MTTKKLTNETFIAKAKTIHGDRYDYSLVEYTASKNKVSIICPIHGIFEQLPFSHLSGAICKECSVDKARHTNETFIAKSISIHGDKYDYSLVDYKTNIIKVTLVCQTHGQFLIRPVDHFKNTGCPVCTKLEATHTGWSRTSFKEKCDKNNNGIGILYVLECFNDSEKFYKIGITSNSVKKRYDSKTKLPYLYSIVKEIIGDPIEIYNLETKLHQLNKENHYVPEIPFAGSKYECFSVYKEIV